MLRIAKPFAIALLLLVSASIGDAQVQRLAIAPSGPVTIGPGQDVSVPSYCLDGFRAEPGIDPLPFVLTPEANASVKFGNNILSLQEAIQKGIITITGTGGYDSVSIVSNVSAPLQIAFTGPVVLSEALEPLRGLQLNNVRSPRANETQQSVQDAIWDDTDRLLGARLRQLMPNARGRTLEELYSSYLHNNVDGLLNPHAAAMRLLFGNDITTIQQDLKGLGLYAGAVDGVNGAGTLAAVKVFQLANGLQPTGFVTPQTKSEVERSVLERIGCKAETLEAAVRQFQQHSKLSVTGTLDAKTKSRVSSDLGKVQSLLKAASSRGNVHDIYRRYGVFVQRAGAETIALIPDDFAIREAWVISDQTVKARLTGDAIYERIDQALNNEISTRSSTKSNVAFLHAGSISNQSGTSTIQFDKSSASVTLDQFKQLFASETQPIPAIDELFPDRSTAGSRQKVLIVRDVVRELSQDSSTADGTSSYWSAGLSRYRYLGDRLRPDPRKLLVALNNDI